MTTYYSTFSSGLSEIIKKVLKQQLDDVTVDLLLDGLIVYTSNKPLQLIKRIRYFNNTFLLLYLFKELRTEAIPFMMNSVLKKPQLINAPRWALKGNKFFRIMASKENQTVPINKDVLIRLENFFSFKLGLKVHRSKPDVEVWFLVRSEGYGFVGVRITHSLLAEKNLQRGELKPELANILCLISEPRKGDILLDPFAGSGAIPAEWAKNFPYRKIIASDNDRNIILKLRKKLSGYGSQVFIEEWDAINLKTISDNSIDKIVTDPPWGIYTNQDNAMLEKLYSDILQEFGRILSVDGVVVILMGQKEIFSNILQKCNKLILIEKYDILVSGKKAAIYKLIKSPPIRSLPNF